MTLNTFNSALKDGDFILLIDRKERQYLRRLTRGKVSEIRGVRIAHDEIVGQEPGFTLGDRAQFMVLRPRLIDYVILMKRGAQIIYPKDIGSILLWADVFPGATVIECGLGSGSLTLHLLRAVGKEGKVISYDRNRDFARTAIRNISDFMGAPENFIFKEQDAYLGIEEREVDRVIVDLPEPWSVVPHAALALATGGIWLSYSPNAQQSQQVVFALESSKSFCSLENFEVLQRFWTIQGPSLRPDHRMVAHTGFITVARKRK
ncbi:MAG: tRNA (adenine-N1)-methyltransferase [Deltaproteobacteria bacterium]|nr:tRNA (adenine-N1)-methyltransferase [Deltaproteobacteria bacterium]